MSARKSVADYIENNVDYLIESTCEFIRTPSSSGSEGKVARLLISKLRELGFDSTSDRMGNVVSSFCDKGKICKCLVFNVHLDTVPVGAVSSWKHEPLGGTVEDGKIYGRGASDTKGAWAPIMLAMKAIDECGMKLDGQVFFTAVVMEELTYCIGIKTLLEETLRDVPPDFIILGEPTGLKVAIGHRGRAELEIVTSGRSCHASAPWRGENALYSASKVIGSLESLARYMDSLPGDEDLGRSSMSVTDIRCLPGARNVIPDECRMFVDYRFLPNENIDSIIKKVKFHIDQHGIHAQVNVSESDESAYTGVKFRGQKYMPGFTLAKAHPLVKAVAGSVKASLSADPSLCRWDFTTDGGWSMGVLGIPTVGFSPGEEHLAHMADEHVRIDYMIKAAKVYSEIIMRLCCADPH